GLICTSITAERARELELPPMASSNTDPMKTAFTVSIDLAEGISTGISATDRAATIAALLSGSRKPADFSRPGHVFPLVAKRNGVLERPGHTEASVDLSTLAGLAPSGVICEIANDDGTMSRLPQLIQFAREHGLLLVTIRDLIAYRKRTEILITKVGECAMPTRFGVFQAHAYWDELTGIEHIALVKDGPSNAEAIVRVHSECVTGEALGSLRCDCGEQLERALAIIGASVRGCLVYIRGHEGRGIGLANKIRAYALQDDGYDTSEANRALGLADDSRDYFAAAGILKDLAMHEVVLLTNSPAKMDALASHGIAIARRRGLLVASSSVNQAYLKTKADKYGHFLEVSRALAG
ncbi:GTP cyclohydrolase II, partial [Mesorhizobium sp. M7A.F.Ca.US.011.01.1.1]|uniref:GTP cyclohydrolase II n=1 Tax=Mesorhizobium sp. M7A.F.Ca.US.011.01.1.1 TaxID=2496741 RepID=UPI000FCAF56B